MKRDVTMLGIGLDAADGHTRITRAKQFYLHGGSEETHTEMQEVCTKVVEGLKKSGKSVGDCDSDELRARVRDVHGGI